MQNEYSQRSPVSLDEKNEKLRREVMRALEPYGERGISDLSEMSEGERAKWLFWNLHENLDEIRRLEPKLIAQVIDTQLTIRDGHSMWTEKVGVEKKLALNCKWYLLLVYTALQNEDSFLIGDGWIDLFISNSTPHEPVLQKNQKGYLDADNSLHPGQIFLNGWITEDVWEEIRQHLYSTSPHCQTELFLRDSFLFPVKPGFDFVTGPPGSIGVSNLEFRVSSHTTDRRTVRRNESSPR